MLCVPPRRHPYFPTVNDKERYPRFQGWPEWFSRGWTLQELIAPKNVQFLNENWQRIGDKRALAPTLRKITGVPEHILIHGLYGNRPCVAQIMSWAARRTTTRVEDRAYSLMGLLDVNMPMLYGEGKKAFHRLQLEIIRASNDQSIFAWGYGVAGVRTGSILAGDPWHFWRCGEMELMGDDEFIEYLKEYATGAELDSVEDRLGTFPITNRGIQIWMPLCGFRTLFRAWLPCRLRPRHPPVTIPLSLWESNYYRCPVSYLFDEVDPEGPLRFHQVYLRYQDPPHRSTTFEIDDSALTENGFTCCDTYPVKFTGDTLTLTSTDSLCTRVYSDNLTNEWFVVGLGLCFGKDWVHVFSDGSNTIPRPSWQNYIENEYDDMLINTPEHAQHMNKARSGAERSDQVCIMQIRLPRTTRILQTSSVIWRSSRMNGVKLEVFHDPGFGDVSGEWTAFDVNVGSFCTSHWHQYHYLFREQTIPAVTGGVS